jgi:hypothetical protein
MSEESIAINQPRFVISSDGIPLVGIAGHPLSTALLGQSQMERHGEKGTDNDWFGMYMYSREFDRMCNETSPKEIRRYFAENDMTTHKRKLQEQNVIAMTIEKQRFLRELFKQWVAHTTKV